MAVLLNAATDFEKEFLAMAGDKLHADGRSGVSARGQAGNGSAGAWRQDAPGGAMVDLQATAVEQSTALYQLLDDVFAALYE